MFYESFALMANEQIRETPNIYYNKYEPSEGFNTFIYVLSINYYHQI